MNRTDITNIKEHVKFIMFEFYKWNNPKDSWFKLEYKQALVDCMESMKRNNLIKNYWIESAKVELLDDEIVQFDTSKREVFY